MDNMINMPSQTNVVGEAPQSQVRLYSGVPWDDSYEHVRLYASQSALLTALEQWKVNTIDQMAPVRIGSLVIKVPFEEMSMLDVNYLAFQNTGISSEWVFCFVTGIEWQSRNSTIVKFKQDIFQCNIYKATLKPCFIERSHIAKSADTVGNNLVEDNLDPGELRCYGRQNMTFGDRYVSMMVTELPDGSDLKSSGEGNVLNACQISHHGYGGTVTWDEFAEDFYDNYIKAYVEQGNIDAVLNIYMSCQLCKDGGIDNTTIDRSQLFGGYTPKNNKLYQYPYCYILATNNNGAEMVLKYELSENPSTGIKVEIWGEMTPMPTVLLYPVGYDGLTGGNYLHRLAYTNFGQCSWKSDVYTAWLAQNRNTIAYSAASAAAQPLKAAITGAATGSMFGPAGSGIGAIGGVVSGALSTFDTMASMMAQAKDRAIIPPEIHGTANSQNINQAFLLEYFSLYKMSCSYDVAKSIDDYWTAFGYPIKEIQTPNLNVRSTWNFIKTAGCNIQGPIDLDQRSALREIFDRGVTIWHTDDIGNYSLANN